MTPNCVSPSQIRRFGLKTGVTVAVSGNDLIFGSVEYGTAAEVTIDVSNGTFIVAAGNSTTDTGTDVEAGDLLFVIDPREYEAELAAARAELTAAEAEVRRAGIEYKRQEAAR